MAIRYDQQFNREIARVVANFNKKVKRLERADRDLLPDTVKVSDLKKEYTKRSDLKRALRDLQNFSERGAENVVQVGNLTTTNWQLQINKREAANAKRNLTREINQIESTARGQASLRADYLQNLRYRRNFLNLDLRSLSKSQLRTRSKIIQQDKNADEKANSFYNNVFDMLFRSAYQAGISKDTILPLLNQLKKLTPAELGEAIQTHAVFRDFLDRYNIYTGVGEGSEETGSALERSVERLKDAMPTILSYYT